VVGRDADNTENSEVISFSGRSIQNYSGQHKSGNYALRDNNRTIELSGNTWKKVLLSNEIFVDSYLEVSVETENVGEIIGIGLDNDNIHNNQITHFQLSGSQEWHNGYRDFNSHDGDQTQTFAIPVGAYFTGKFNYLTFVMDDNASANGKVTFKNIRIYRK